MQESIQPFEIARMFLGEEDPLFYLEIVVRTTIIYLYSMLLIRWLGSRSIGQLSIIEFLLVIALGSAIGDPMFQPDVPLFHAMGVITVVILLNKAFDWIIVRSKKAELVIDGQPEEIISHGVMFWQKEQKTLIGKSELFQILRQHGVSQLGEVSHAYLEPSGSLSIFKEITPKAGLPIVPPWSIKSPNFIDGSDVLAKTSDFACTNCGFVINAEQGKKIGSCQNCDEKEWLEASISIHD